MKAEKWMDELRYIGIPVYVRMHGFVKPAEVNQVSPVVLYNVHRSRAIKGFISGMTKISFAEMDMKTVGMLAVVAVGIGLGMLYFMGGIR